MFDFRKCFDEEIREEDIQYVSDHLVIIYANISDEENERRKREIGRAAGRLLVSLWEAEAEERVDGNDG